MGLTARLTAALFGRRLWLTNTLSSGLLLAVGDAIQQTVELRRGRHADGRFCWSRAGRMLAVGLIQGPPHHLWYTWLDRRLPGRAGRTVRLKILADQLAAAPLFAVTFFLAGGLLEGHTVQQCWREIRRKFPEVYLFDWLIWPPTQWINFSFVPAPYRVIYINAVTVLWDVFLSYSKHRDQLSGSEHGAAQTANSDAAAGSAGPPSAADTAAAGQPALPVATAGQSALSRRRRRFSESG